MIVVKPYAITDAIFTSSVAEPSAGETVWSAGSYSIGTELISTVTHKVYKSIVDSNTLDPTLDVYDDSGLGTSWLIVGPTNKWAIFDGIIGNTSTIASPLNISFEAGQIVNSIAVFGMTGVSSATVTVTVPVDGVVFEREIDLIDNSAVIDYYTYLFEPIVRKTQFVLIDLPPYLNADIAVTFEGLSDVSVGEVVIGRSIDIGTAVYGTGLGLLDFSVANADEFGNFTGMTRRRFSKLVDFDVRIKKDRINYVFDEMSKLRATFAVWIGEGTTDDATLVYGPYQGNYITLNQPSYCDFTIKVQGVT